MINSCHNSYERIEWMNHKILLFVSTIILNIQTGTCELPQPLAYYSFESRQPSTLDRSFNNHTALATGNYSFIDKGAPEGASPGAAIELNGGHLRIPSIDMNSMIRDSENGSYTMSAWIKPTDLGGENFFSVRQLKAFTMAFETVDIYIAHTGS